MDIIFLFFGILGLVVSAHYVVKASTNLANYFKVSELFVGLTVVSIGTSLPEIAVSIASGINKLKGIDASAIAIGNVIGSALSLSTLFLGIIVLFGTIKISKRSIKRDGIALIATIIILFLIILDLKVTRLEAAILIIFYVFYLFNLKGEARLYKNPQGRRPKMYLFFDSLLLVGGLALIIYSSNTVVHASVNIAKFFNIKESIIGLLIIGIGTNLPELTVSIGAMLKKSYRLAAGNIIGSNIANLLLSLGAGALIAGFTVDIKILTFDILFLFFATILVLVFFSRNKKLSGREGVILILIYIVYVWFKLTLHT